MRGAARTLEATPGIGMLLLLLILLPKATHMATFRGWGCGNDVLPTLGGHSKRKDKGDGLGEDGDHEMERSR